MFQKLIYNKSFLLSALILFGAFFSPSYFFIGSLFFCIPLFVRIIQKNDLTWHHGFVWGIVFFSLHWIALIPLLYSRAYGIMRMLGYPLFVLYASCWTSIWFFCMSFFIQQKKECVIIIITWIYFYFWENYAFFFINKNFGYCLGSPLLPLNTIFGWRCIVSVCNINVLLFSVIFLQYFVSVWWIKKKYFYICLFFFTFIFLFFLHNYFQQLYQKNDLVKKYDHIVHIKPLKKNSTDYWYDAQQLCDLFAQTLLQYKKSTVLIMPESSFPFALNRHADVVQLWTEKALGDSITLIIGAHRREGSNLFNSMYFIHNGQITHIYDKKKLVPCVEYVPSCIAHCNSMQNLFLHKSHAFSPGQINVNATYALNDLCVEPYICFDFFKHFPRQRNKNNNIIVLLNESWFFFEYIQYLMFLYACFVASYLQITIYYIAYHNAYIINPLFYICLYSQ